MIALSANAELLLRVFAATAGPIGMFEAADVLLAPNPGDRPEYFGSAYDLLIAGASLYNQGCIDRVVADGVNGDLYEPTEVGRRIAAMPWPKRNGRAWR
ncbi:hypothetical protein Caci_2910 [Catenulispora acidiphila DSM 44928]|uniref:Uncharacterized protein n=1 Tax=Catenulispora acidiphila (strain DSM 44928 / JCM 14897 / NBRC 102108 / NRRL B-24433 / ID139908) TaxID=479433 RepID=C7Q2S7_CATAD|nr:hypothetical protein [Catenulispora acidiphila]ACU71819.1 hypothetical protein Caci_2910 [Catenulispora acidiphila DSM 44928]